MSEPNRITALKRARTEKGWTQREAARRVGVDGMDPGHFHRIETGDVRPHPRLAREISLAFGNAVTRDQLLFPEDYMTVEEPVEAKAS